MEKPSSTVGRALEIMDVLGRHDRPLHLWEIARRTRIPESTAHRILNTMASRGYVRQSYHDATYHLGWQIVTLAESVGVHGQLPRILRPHLEDLSLNLRRSINLVGLNGPDALYIQSVPSPDGISLHTPTGGRFPAYASASGKVLLAALDEAEIEVFLSSVSFERRTKYTLRNQKQLKEALAAVRENGYATDNQECDLGISCIAAPLIDKSGGAIAAVSVTARTIDLPGDWIRQYRRPLLRACRQMSKEVAG